MKHNHHLLLSIATLLATGLLAMSGCKASGMALTERGQFLKINIDHPNDLPEGAEGDVEVLVSNRGLNDIKHVLTDVELPPQLIVLGQTANSGIAVVHDPGTNVYHFTIPKIHPAEDAHLRFHVKTAFGTAKETGSINVTAWQRDLPGQKLPEHAAIKLRA